MKTMNVVPGRVKMHAVHSAVNREGTVIASAWRCLASLHKGCDI